MLSHGPFQRETNGPARLATLLHLASHKSINIYERHREVGVFIIGANDRAPFCVYRNELQLLICFHFGCSSEADRILNSCCWRSALSCIDLASFETGPFHRSCSPHPVSSCGWGYAARHHSSSLHSCNIEKWLGKTCIVSLWWRRRFKFCRPKNVGNVIINKCWCYYQLEVL